MDKIQDDDLMLVSRGVSNYNVRGEDVYSSMGGSKVPPTIASISLVDNNTSPGRFTEESFTTTITMSDDQNSTKQLDYYVTGDLQTSVNVPILDNNRSKLAQTERTKYQGGTGPVVFGARWVTSVYSVKILKLELFGLSQEIPVTDIL